MLEFYIFLIVVSAVAIFSRKLGLMIILVGGAAFLYMLPSTQRDYDHYEDAFNNAIFVPEFPWFVTRTNLVAEPLYQWYSSAASVLIAPSFQVFLAFNFLVCFCISFFAFRNAKQQRLSFFWVFAFPVIFPTLFYFSPRSSISFFLVLLSVVQLSDRQYVRSALVSFAACMVHSQFIPYTVFIYGTAIVLDVTKFQWTKSTLFAFATILAVTVPLAKYATPILHAVLSVLPSAAIATSKLHYLQDARSGFRLTSVLSLVVYPVLVTAIGIRLRKSDSAFFFKDSDRDKRFFNLLVAGVLFGMIFNIVFFTTPHLSGRLCRFPDYSAAAIILPGFFMLYRSSLAAAIVGLLLAVVAPVAYPTIYKFISDLS